MFVVILCNDGVNLGFKEHDIINVTQKTTLKSLRNAFEGEDMQSHYRVLGYEIDFYFHEYKLATEIDECNHEDRDINHEIERQKALEKELRCKFIRINPDNEGFNVFKTQNKIFRHIKESNKRLTEKSIKKSLIDKLSSELLRHELEKVYQQKHNKN